MGDNSVAGLRRDSHRGRGSRQPRKSATVAGVNLYAYVPSPWRPLISERNLEGISEFLTAETNAGRPWHPAPERMFASLTYFTPQQTRVVILGQDPYPRAGQPTGLAFSLPDGKMSPSARNILAELSSDLECLPPQRADFSRWAYQGVLLWNSAATTQVGVAGAHARCGWHEITRALMAGVVAANPEVVFVCWGGHAREVAAPAVAAGAHMIWSNHPSPLSARRGPRPFIGSRPFSAVNAILAECGRDPIDWALEAR